MEIGETKPIAASRGIGGGRRGAAGFRFFGQGYFGEGSLAFPEGQGGFEEGHGVNPGVPEGCLGLRGRDESRLEGWLAPPVRYRVAISRPVQDRRGRLSHKDAGGEKSDDFLLSDR